MTRWMLAGLMALVGLGVVGAPVQADPADNPFAGSWSGTWGHGGEVFGTFDWTISDAGRIDGTITHAGRPDGDGGMVGHVHENGEITFVGMVPGDVPGNTWGNGFCFKGTAVIDDQDRLVASVALAAPPFPNQLDVILERN